MAPEMKDEDLHSGFLQHAKGATLVLTEGAITEGGINSQGKVGFRLVTAGDDMDLGIQNLRSIQETMQTQSLDYRFPFSSTFSFETDLNFIITTQGKKSTFFQVSRSYVYRSTHESHDHSDQLCRSPQAQRRQELVQSRK